MSCVLDSAWLQQTTYNRSPTSWSHSLLLVLFLSCTFSTTYMMIQCFSLCSSFSELRVSTETAIWFYKGMHEFSFHSFLPIFDSFGFIRDKIVCSWLYLMPYFLYWNYPSPCLFLECIPEMFHRHWIFNFRSNRYDMVKIQLHSFSCSLEWW